MIRLHYTNVIMLSYGTCHYAVCPHTRICMYICTFLAGILDVCMSAYLYACVYVYVDMYVKCKYIYTDNYV